MMITDSGWRRRSALLASLALVSVGLAMTGCRENEQNRILSYEPGKYQGKQDTDATLDEGTLRNRALQIQNFN